MSVRNPASPGWLRGRGDITGKAGSGEHGERSLADAGGVLKVPIGPLPRTPEIKAGILKGQVKWARDQLANHSNISAKTWIRIGESLASTKGVADELGRGVFRDLFPKANTASDLAKYPFSFKTAQMLMWIAERLATSGSNFGQLPASWRTLYVLSCIPPKQLIAHIESGAVHPMMTRAQASKLMPKKSAAPERARSVQAWAQSIRRCLSPAEVAQLAKLLSEAAPPIAENPTALEARGATIARGAAILVSPHPWEVEPPGPEDKITKEYFPAPRMKRFNAPLRAEIEALWEEARSGSLSEKVAIERLNARGIKHPDGKPWDVSRLLWTCWALGLRKLYGFGWSGLNS